MAIANADIANATLKERWTFATPTPLVARKMAALLQVILDTVWLEISPGENFANFTTYSHWRNIYPVLSITLKI
jgi:hypothetical protein